MSASRVVLVTGAARGIGAATVRRLCAQGAHVVALDSCAGTVTPDGVDYPLATREDLDAVVAQHPDQVIPVVADVRDATALVAAADEAVRRLGRMDAVIAAAAVISGGDPQWRTPPAHLDALLAVDVGGVWNAAAAVVPHMLSGPDPAGCRIVAVASAAGTHGLFGLAGYCAAKHAVIGLIRGLAADLTGTGVTAVAVSPGATRTAMLEATAGLYGTQTPDGFAESSRLRRLLEPDELAGTLAFCASREAGVLNGSVIEATGGFIG